MPAAMRAEARVIRERLGWLWCYLAGWGFGVGKSDSCAAITADVRLAAVVALTVTVSGMPVSPAVLDRSTAFEVLLIDGLDLDGDIDLLACDYRSWTMLRPDRNVGSIRTIAVRLPSASGRSPASSTLDDMARSWTTSARPTARTLQPERSASW